MRPGQLATGGLGAAGVRVVDGGPDHGPAQAQGREDHALPGPGRLSMGLAPSESATMDAGVVDASALPGKTSLNQAIMHAQAHLSAL